MSTQLLSASFHRESLHDYWLPVEFAKRIGRDAPYGVQVFGRPIVLFRDRTGVIRCLEDRCPHRAAPLSLGNVSGGRLRCPYHGWEFDGCGRCARIPSVADKEIEAGRQLIRILPAAEKGGMVWVWPGNPDLADEATIPLPSLPPADEPFAALKEHYDIASHYSLLSANLSDPAHVQFVHAGILARIVRRKSYPVRFLDVGDTVTGWPVGRTEVENNGRMSYYHYEYQSPFLITKTVKSWFGKKPVTNFHWEFAVPLKRNLTRFFFFQYRTFFNGPLTKRMMAPLYRHMAKKVTEEDRRIIEAQQSQLEQGAVFNALVPADRLLRRYHRKINMLERPTDWFAGFDVPYPSEGSVSQSAVRQEEPGRPYIGLEETAAELVSPAGYFADEVSVDNLRGN
ncbi:MAG: aromatic ring-hydroxylating dioxygenase subunit alpha [Gammaproteobacteria bacterium]|nr:aromatic ring-hydroxylating dioxygenase subunit alpha [Gammaproteobacteria bacterium]